MSPVNLHVVGVDPGGTTGWACMTVPRASFYGDAPGQIVEWDYGEFYGDENVQVRDLCRLFREIQSLDYKIGPGVVVEDFDIEDLVTKDKELLSPVRIAAKLNFAFAMGLGGDSRITMQGRTMAKSTITDDRLRNLGFWVEGSRHICDAAIHAITALRRAKESKQFRDALWYNGDQKTEVALFGRA